jgi:uncharacterized protein YndB with AHSA1/START domain
MRAGIGRRHTPRPIRGRAAAFAWSCAARTGRNAGSGEHTVVDPPRRLAFSWTWDAESAEGHAEGWEITLDNLARKALGARA